MNTSIKSKIVRIGNSQGIRIPKVLIDQAKLKEDVNIEAKDGRLIITPAKRPREGWEEQFAEMAEQGQDSLLDGYIPTKFDDEEWEW